MRTIEPQSGLVKRRTTSTIVQNQVNLFNTEENPFDVVSSRISEHEVDIFDFEAIKMTLQQPATKKEDFVLTMRSL
jgi:hypothetical protein